MELLHQDRVQGRMSTLATRERQDSEADIKRCTGNDSVIGPHPNFEDVLEALKTVVLAVGK